ncbi:MAG: tRNA lysidine(34) synthetase TilS [Erythrobacter sp.]
MLDPELIDRFAADLAALWPPDERDGALGLAVSGGPDSLALLLLAHAAMPGAIAVASIDHGLRAEAAGEVALVEQVCQMRAIPFTALRVNPAPGNLQAQARIARYAALGKWAKGSRLGALATAHHADDQAETLLLRLNRGSGLSGLAGVRAASLIDEDVLLLRPLLGWRKAELEEIVAAAGITPVRDPSNENRDFARVRMREQLAATPWLDAAALATSAGHLAEGWRAIEWYAGLDWDEMVHPDEDAADGAPGLVYFANVPRVVAIETISRIVRELGGHCSRAEAARAFDRLWRGENASLGGVLAVPGIERMKGIGVELRCWRFAPEPPRRLH